MTCISHVEGEFLVKGLYSFIVALTPRHAIWRRSEHRDLIAPYHFTPNLQRLPFSQNSGFVQLRHQHSEEPDVIVNLR